MIFLIRLNLRFDLILRFSLCCPTFIIGNLLRFDDAKIPLDELLFLGDNMAD